MYARGDKGGAHCRPLALDGYLELSLLMLPLLLLIHLMSESMPDFNSHYAHAIITLISSFSYDPPPLKPNYAEPYNLFRPLIYPNTSERFRHWQ